LEPLFIDLLTFRQSLLPSSERCLQLTARCRHGEQFVTTSGADWWAEIVPRTAECEKSTTTDQHK